MIVRMVMPRALARLAALLHTPAHRVAAAPSPATTTTGATLTTTTTPPSQAREVVPAVAAGVLPAHGRARTDTAPPAPAPSGPRHEEGLVHARARRWGHAQRALETALRADPEPRAAADLASVREVRRQLRIVRKWPRDVPAHVALGRAYMDLDLGPEAEAAFLRAIALAPTEPAAYGHLALEYGYRGELTAAERAYDRARVLGADLPPFAALLAEWSALPGAAPTARAPDAIAAGAGEGAASRACGPDQAKIPPRARDEGRG